MNLYNDRILPFPRSYWVIPGKLLAGHIPTDFNQEISEHKINRLISSGIKTFINLQEEDEVNELGERFPDYSNFLYQYAERNNVDLYFHRFPIKDLHTPVKPLMKEILNKINLSISLMRPVYIHCWGGIGRTGTVVGCFLLQNNYADKNNVVDMIRYLRRTDPKSHRSSPETEEQIKFILNWEK